MKKITINSIIYLVSILFVTTSCEDFLTQEAQSKLSEERMFSNLGTMEALVDGLYKSWRDSKSGRDGMSYTLMGLDESRQGNYQVMTEDAQASLDKYNAQLNSTNTKVAEIWSKRWPAITTSAKLINAFNYTEGDEDRIKSLLGESSFIRAALTWETSMLFGEVPIIDVQRADELGYSRKPLKDVYEFIISDLELAEANLPEVQSEKYRITKGAAQSLLGKIYMSAPEESGYRNFEKARDYFKKVIDSSQYGLLSDFGNLFGYQATYTEEAILLFPYTDVSDQQNKWQWDTGSRAAAEAFGHQRCYFAGWDALLPTEYAAFDVENGGVWEQGDLRKEVSIRYEWGYEYEGVWSEPGPVWWGAGGDELEPHIKKWEDYRNDQYAPNPYGDIYRSGCAYHYLRYADILLCYAECLNELGQTASAIEVVNTVRTRAWGGSLPSDKAWAAMSQDDFREAIMDERIRELCFEGWRRIDLIRTGNFVKYVSDKNKWAKENGTLQEYHMRYPIPTTELLSNPDISEADQNPGYR